MFRFALFVITAVVFIAAVVWLIIDNPGHTMITWGQWSLEMTTATLLLGTIALYILLYISIFLFRQLLGLRRRLQRRKATRLTNKANHSLTQGLIHLAEGNWEKAEKHLIEFAPYSHTPLLHYLTAARAAHMQEKTESRDELLKQALESDDQAQIAVGVSQAEMQLASKQLEQAQANLQNLRELAPKNLYILKLTAKTLFQQQDWESLLELLPELVKYNLVSSKNMRSIKSATLQGIFNHYAVQKKVPELQATWKKLPAVIREQSEAMQLYASSLHQAEAQEQCIRFINTVLNKNWVPELAELYGRIQHPQADTAIKQAEKWLLRQPENPTTLLLLARLHCQQELWGVARSYYETSLNQAPNTKAYLELAELLEVMGETKNAERCYRLGLRHAIRGQSERLVLIASSQLKPALLPEAPPTQPVDYKINDLAPNRLAPDAT